MKKLVLFLIVMLFMMACNNEADVTCASNEVNAAMPYGIEAGCVDFSYSESGSWMPDYVCTDGYDGSYTLGTQGDMAIRILFHNTTKYPQKVARQNFVIDLDGKVTTIPTFMYNEQVRAKKYIVIQPMSYAQVIIYIENIFGRMYGNWKSAAPDYNACYSIDIMLGENYLYGCNIYAHSNTAGEWNKRY